jgi:hypothetical protein
MTWFDFRKRREAGGSWMMSSALIRSCGLELLGMYKGHRPLQMFS